LCDFSHFCVARGTNPRSSRLVNQFNRIGVRFPIFDSFNALKFEFSRAQRSYLGPGPPDLNFSLKALVLVPRVIAQGLYEPDVIRSHDVLPPISQNKLIPDARATLIWIKLELGKRSPILPGMIGVALPRLRTRRITIKEAGARYSSITIGKDKGHIV
jgi:hypothetical protein